MPDSLIMLLCIVWFVCTCYNLGVLTNDTPESEKPTNGRRD